MISNRLNKMQVPIIQGGMGIGISMGSLAGAVAKEGGMGVISTANIGFQEPDFWERPKEAHKRALIREIRRAKEISEGNGIIAINAMVVTTNYEDAVRTACSEGIDAVISGAGVPLALPEYIEGYSVLAAPIVSSGKAAKTICNVWSKRYHRLPDFLVIEGSEAGGHLGFAQSDVEEGKTTPLEDILKDVLNVLSSFDAEIPVFVAGGIFDSDDIKKMIDLGAFGVQIATRFIATEECDASQALKEIILQAADGDVGILKSPVGMPGRGLLSPLAQRARIERIPPKKCIRCISTCDCNTTPYCINQALIDAFYGQYESGLFFCGSNVGRINQITTVPKLIKELMGG